MMKRIAAWIIAVMFFIGTTPICVADEGGKGPNPSKEAYEHANEHARFKRTENFKDKEAIKAEREAKRASEKVRREVEKEKRRAEREAKKKHREMERGAKKMKRSFGR